MWSSTCISRATQMTPRRTVQAGCVPVTDVGVAAPRVLCGFDLNSTASEQHDLEEGKTMTMKEHGRGLFLSSVLLSLGPLTWSNAAEGSAAASDQVNEFRCPIKMKSNIFSRQINPWPHRLPREPDNLAVVCSACPPPPHPSGPCGAVGQPNCIFT